MDKKKKRKLLPRYQVGDRVVKSSHKGPNFTGTVIRVIEPEEIDKLLKEIDPTKIHQYSYQLRDKDWKKSQLYIVEPDSSPGMATYEEACCIVPGLTPAQYDQLIGKRVFTCLDSDLLPHLISDK